MTLFQREQSREALFSLFKLSGPIVLANVLQTTYQLIDTFWLGRIGAEAVAAVSLSFPLLFLIISLGIGLTIAGSIMVAQYSGMRDQRMINYSTAQTYLIMFFVSVMLATAGYFFSDPLMRLIGAEGQILKDAVDYFRVSSIGFIFLFMFFVYQSLMRGIGNVVGPTFVVLTTVVLNLFLDPLFIYGWGPVPEMGVSGAAMASVLTQGLAALIGFVIIYRGRSGIQFNFQDFRWDLRFAKTMFKLGIPSSLELSTRALGMTFLIVLVTSFGSMVMASYGIGARILSFVIIPALGLSAATTTLVGQRMGAKEVEKARDIGVMSQKVAFFGLTGIGLIMFVFAEQLTAFFVPGETEVIKNGAMFIKVMAPSFGLLGIQQVTNGVFNGAGFTMASMIMSIIALWVIRFPLAWFLSYCTELSYNGIWWSFPISNLIAAGISIAWFRKGTWQLKKRVSFQAD